VRAQGVSRPADGSLTGQPSGASRSFGSDRAGERHHPTSLPLLSASGWSAAAKPALRQHTRWVATGPLDIRHCRGTGGRLPEAPSDARLASLNYTAQDERCRAQLLVCLARPSSAEERGFDGRGPQSKQTPAFGTSSETVFSAGRNEHERPRSDALCRSRSGVEGVRALEDVEGFCFVVYVGGIVESGVLPRLPQRPMPTSLATGCLAGDVPRCSPIGRMMLSPSPGPRRITFGPSCSAIA